jgi:hypothetical protein
MPKQKITSTATMNADFPARFLPMISIEGCSRGTLIQPRRRHPCFFLIRS